MEPTGAPTINNLLNAVTIIVCFPLAFALYGVFGYHTSASSMRIEMLYFAGFMGLATLVVFIPYLVAILIKWRQVRMKNLVISIIPFTLIAMICWYAAQEEAPV